MRALARTVLLISSVLLILTSCALGGSAHGPSAVTKDMTLSAATDIDALHENRTEYLGDNSRVLALVEATGPEVVGEQTLELHTDDRPYVLVMAFSSVDVDVTSEIADDLMTDRAVLLLATIDNVDEIRWKLPESLSQEPDGSLSRAEADALIGSSAAGMGATAGSLTELVEFLQDA